MFMGDDAVRSVQTVLMMQSYGDKFEHGNRYYNTSTLPGTFLMNQSSFPERSVDIRCQIGDVPDAALKA